MPFNVIQEPRAFEVVGRPLVSTSIQTETLGINFYYVFEVSDLTLLNTKNFYSKINPNGRGMFDLSPLFRHELTVDEVDSTDGKIIHNLPHSEDNFMSKTSTNARFIGISYDYAEGEPLVVTDTGNSHLMYLVGGRVDIAQGIDYDYSEVITTGATKKGFLVERKPSKSNVINTSAIEIPTNENDYGTLAFWNDSANLGSEATKLRYRIYNALGLQGTDTFTIGTTYGGAAPTSFGADGKVIYFGAYPKNINDANHAIPDGFKPQDIANWTYYTWELIDNESNAKSAPIYFVNSCEPKASVIVSWENSYGVWEYYKFDARKTNTITTERKNYRKSIGTWDGTEFGYNTFDRDLTPYQVEARKKYVLKTSDLTFENSELLTSLMRSKKVMMYSDQWLPIVVDKNSYQYEKDNFAKRITAEFEVTQAQC
jgi:hypothetical protein